MFLYDYESLHLVAAGSHKYKTHAGHKPINEIQGQNMKCLTLQHLPNIYRLLPGRIKTLYSLTKNHH